MKEEWLMPGAVVPVDAETTAALVSEIKRLIGVVGSIALSAQPAQQESVDWEAIAADQAMTIAMMKAELQKPLAMRMPKVGDRVVCIEDDSLATIVGLTGGGSPEIKFDDGSRGTYLLREFADLFRYENLIDQRRWIGLTDQEIEDLWNQHEPRFDFYSFSCDIEAKLKEKNA